MNRTVLLIIIVAIIGVGIWAGTAVLGIAVGRYDSWTPRNYVAKPGDCFVPPQGDPLYDAHYAKEVNRYNCDAFKVQSEAKNIDAQTEQVRVETRTGIFGVLVVIGVVGATLILIIVATVK